MTGKWLGLVILVCVAAWVLLVLPVHVTAPNPPREQPPAISQPPDTSLTGVNTLLYPVVGKHYLVKDWYGPGGDIEEVVVLGFSKTRGSVEMRLEHIPNNCCDKWWPMSQFRTNYIDEAGGER